MSRISGHIFEINANLFQRIRLRTAVLGMVSQIPNFLSALVRSSEWYPEHASGLHPQEPIGLPP